MKVTQMTHRSQATPTRRQATQTTTTITATVISERGTTSATEVATEGAVATTITTRTRMLPIKRRAKKASRTILEVETITTQAGEESLKCTTSRRSRVVAVGIRVLQQQHPRRTRL